MSNEAHNDKRTPHTDALETLGMIHFKPEARDAIHLAVEPVNCGTVPLVPGERIGIVDGTAYPAGTNDKTGKVPYHGIVDPFLSAAVKPGERFWFVMRPRLVQSLRHVWEHPDFPKGA